MDYLNGNRQGSPEFQFKCDVFYQAFFPTLHPLKLNYCEDLWMFVCDPFGICVIVRGHKGVEHNCMCHVGCTSGRCHVEVVLERVTRGDTSDVEGSCVSLSLCLCKIWEEECGSMFFSLREK